MTTLPFLDTFVPLIRDGQKTCTARTRRYGYVGDILETPAGPIVLTHVFRATLRQVRELYWRQEGCESPSHFESVWRQIHPTAGYKPEQRVWLHIFEVVS